MTHANESNICELKGERTSIHRSDEMAKKPSGSKTTVRFRDAGSGQFVKETKANRMKPENVVRERVPKPGYGDTK